MITLISTPEYIEPTDPTIISRWIATESENNFRLLRTDWLCTGANAGGFLQLTCLVIYTGAVTNDIAVYDSTLDKMYVGTVTNIDGTFKIITTDIAWVAGMSIQYMNDNTIHGGYYFEGRLTINGSLYPLTIKASPDSFGYADLDVSGILRIVTSIGKTGNYSTTLMAEPTKSGNFNFEYRECWYGSSEDWEGVVVTSPIASPPILENWYYAECVRSEEQGSNLHEYVATAIYDAPFLNQFSRPVYFPGLPFDLSFILPETVPVSPMSDIVVTIRRYNSVNTLLGTSIFNVDADSLEGFVNSLNIDPAFIEDDADHLTAEISV
jgi:hypothetical protein